MKKLIITIILASLAVSVMAAKVDRKKFDKNADGKFDKEEWKAYQVARGSTTDEATIKRWFDNNDLNKDGFVTFEEMDKRKAEKAKETPPKK